MPLQPHPYSLLLAVAAALSLAVAVFAWRRRPAPGAVTLAVLNLALAEWAGTYAIQWATTTLPAQVFWLSATFLGVVVALPAVFVFSLQYAHHEAWLTRRNLALLAIHPILTLAVLATDSLHHGFYSRLALEQRAGLVVLNWERGPWFWVTTVYGYVLLLAVFVLLVQALWRSRGPYRAQAATVLLAVLFPWTANLITQSFFRHLSELDLTPVAFALTGVTLAYALLQYRLLDLVPVARGALIENMSDGVLVLDAQSRIVDLNPAAQAVIGGTAAAVVGQPVHTLLSDYPDLVARFRDVTYAQAEIQVGTAHFDLRITPLFDRHRRLTGRLIVWHDVTARKWAEAELRQANERLRQQLAEIEQLQARLREAANRDPLTGLLNRRFLDDALPRELARARREDYPVAVILLDLDHFKAVNDTHGHAAGDQMLLRLSQLLRSTTRAGDLLCRYGGEEFLAVLPNTTAAQAHHRAESWRAAFAQPTPGPQGSLSAGIAIFPTHGATAGEVIRAADQALYAAKDAGRDRVLAYPV